MIPCTFRSNLLISNALMRPLQRQCMRTLTRNYSTDATDATNSTDSTDSTKDELNKNDILKSKDPSAPLLDIAEGKNEERRFYEIDNQPAENSNGSTSKLANTPNKAKANHTREFKDLIERLFATKFPKPSTQTKIRQPLIPSLGHKHKNNSSESSAEKALMNMVLRNKHVYNSKASLPRSILNSLYSPRSNEPHNTHRDHLDPYSSSAVIDFLDKRDDKRGYGNDSLRKTVMKHVSNDERIKLKEKEIQAVQAIIETQTSSELLECIQSEINIVDNNNEEGKVQRYPLYYPNLIVKAMEHALTNNKDPYLALTIFEEAKNKSLMSYIFGCTTPVYNTMLALRWDVWRDVYGMLDLVEEMTLNGIEIDDQSRMIIRKVVNEIEKEDHVELIGEDRLAESKDQEILASSIFWNTEERRSCNLLKELGGKWRIAKQVFN